MIRRRKYWLKIFAFSLLLGTAPVIVLGVLSYYKASETIRHQADEGVRLMLSDMRMKSENKLQTVDYLSTQFINSQLAARAMRIDMQPDQFETVQQLTGELGRLQIFGSGIHDIFLINLQHGWFMHNGGLFPLASLMNKHVLDEYAVAPNTSFWTLADENVYVPAAVRPGGRPAEPDTINLVKKIPVNSSRPTGLLVVKIGKEAMNDQMFASEGAIQFMVLDDSDSVVLHSDKALIGATVAGSALLEQLRGGEPDGQFNMSLNGEEVGVAFSRSGYNDWTYVSIISIDDIMAESKKIGWMTLYTCVVIFVITFALAWSGSLSMYSPVRRLYNKIQAAPWAKTDKHRDEFQLIENRIDNMLHFQSELSVKLKSQLQQLNDFFILRLYRGNIGRDEIEDIIRTYEYPLKWNWLCVLVLDIDTLEGTNFKSQDKNLLMFAINNIISELVPLEQRLSPAAIDQYQVVMIGGNHASKEGFVSYVCSLAVLVQQKVAECVKVKASIGISRPFQNYTEVPQAFEEGIIALSYRVRQGDKSVIYIQDVHADQTFQMIYPKQIAGELIESIRSHHDGKATALLQSFIDKVCGGQSSHLEYQFALVRLLIELSQLVENGGKSIYDVCDDNKSVFDQLFSLKTKDEMETWFLQVITSITQLLEDEHKSKYRKVVETVLHVIHTEYDRDISLEYCASLINYHPSHLRKILQKELKINFSDYLAQVRLDKAKEWLLHTDMTILKIGEKLRYTNSQNFIRSFKKAEGVTPGQYRQQYNPSGDVKK